MKKTMIKIASLVFAAGLLSACNESGFTGLNGMTISEVANGKTYIGTSFSVAPTPPAGSVQLPETLVVNYAANPGIIRVYLNGQAIGQHFSLAPTSASAPFSAFKDFLRQGENTVTVEPLSFGPTLTFSLDSAGPLFTVKEVCTSNDVGCAVSAGETQVRIQVRDASDITELKVENQDAVLVDGLYQAKFTDLLSDSITTITAKDANGYNSSSKYLSEGANNPEIFRAKVGQGVVDGLKPFLSQQIGGTRVDPTGIASIGLNKYLYIGEIGVAHVYVKPLSVYLGNVDLHNFGISSGKINLGMNLYPTVPYTPNDGNVSGNVAISNDGNVANDISEVGVYVDLLMGTTCLPKGWYSGSIENQEHPSFGFCVTDWGHVTLKIERVTVNGEVTASIVNGGFNVSLNDNLDLVLEDTVGAGGGNFLSGLISTFKDLGLFKTIMKNMIEQGIQNNLDKITVGMSFLNDDNEEFALRTTAKSVSFNPGSMEMTYEGKLDVVTRDPDVKRSLGSYYVDTATPGFGVVDVPGEDDNLAVIVNSNIINQGLNTLYSIGMTHFTLTLADQKVAFGPNAVGDSQGADGDMKIELLPSGPGTMRFFGDSTSQVTLAYNDAELIVSRKQSGTWETQFSVNANIEAGVLLKVRDNIITMTIQGIPDLDINEIVNKTPFPLNEAIVTPTLDLMMGIGIPLVANTELVIDVPDIPLNDDSGNTVISSSVTTKAFTTEGGHLSFSMGVNPVVN